MIQDGAVAENPKHQSGANKRRHKDTDKNDSRDSRTDTNKSGLNLEGAKITYLKNIDSFKKMSEKKLIFEQDQDDSTLLDESQLKG